MTDKERYIDDLRFALQDETEYYTLIIKNDTIIVSSEYNGAEVILNIFGVGVVNINIIKYLPETAETLTYITHALDKVNKEYMV